MALNSQNKIAWTYVDDKGDSYAISASKAITDQLDGATPKVGGTPATGDLNPWPRSWRPRKVYCANGLTRRAVVAYSTTAAIWTTAGTTLTLNLGADSATFTASSGHLGERKRSATASST